MLAETFLPLLLLASAIFLLEGQSGNHPRTDRLVVAGVAYILIRYMWWRLTETVLPADPFTLAGLFVWFVFAVELLAWLDTAVLYAYMLRQTDRSPEADRHETRLRHMDPQDLPEVDVFIATYNEPADVLERTIVGALSLDWPRDKLNIWVLDDGRRPWLQSLAQDMEVGYLTRDDNLDAKAGNINAAVTRTSAPFFLVLDADFIPQQRFLFRAMGFFEDPKIGIVQIPHNFFNPDPMQASLNMSKVMPDDQRFFFERIMPGRDGYDCSFCCGSNGIVRRTALEEVGNKLPSGSITEDMLLTLALKRKGYITRYLDERLAFGLAPEDINAFFIQRSRWARGAIQIMFLRHGPFGGKGLKLHERIFFLPLSWITQSFGQTLAMITPALFLLTGIPPLVNATTETVISYQIPAIVAAVASVRYFAPGEYLPLATAAHGAMQAFRLLPVVVATLIKPHGHAFKVTPNGGDGGVVQDGFTIAICLTLCLLMGLGLFLNSDFNLHRTSAPEAMSVVTFWAVANMIILLLVAKIAITPPMPRSEERFEISEDLRAYSEKAEFSAKSIDISVTGTMLDVDAASAHNLAVGDWLGLQIRGVGLVPSRIRRKSTLENGRANLGLAFELPSPTLLETQPAPVASLEPSRTYDWPTAARNTRRRLIRKLFTKERSHALLKPNDWQLGFTMLRSIFKSENTHTNHRPLTADMELHHPPVWLTAQLAQEEHALDARWYDFERQQSSTAKSTENAHSQPRVSEI